MEEFYSNKDNSSTSGPSDLTIKRILAFSKALDSAKMITPQQTQDKQEK